MGALCFLLTVVVVEVDFLVFFVCFFAFAGAVVWVESVAGAGDCFAVFGAAIKKGTATIVSRVEVNSVFIFLFSPSIRGGLSCRSQLYFALWEDFSLSPRFVDLYPVFSG